MANTTSKGPMPPWMPEAWIMLWYDCSQTPTFIIHAASLYYLTHITNVWGCMEMLPTHYGAGSVKVDYYRCMRKIWGLVKPHKVNKLQMRLSYCRIYLQHEKTLITLHK